MPPQQQKRARRYDSAKTRAAVLAQFGHVRDAVAQLGPEQLALPAAGMGEWTVRELLAHLSMAVSSVDRYLRRPAPGRAELALVDWPFATAERAGEVDSDVRELAAASQDLVELYERTGARFAELLPALPDEQVIATRVGPMTAADFLVTRTVELVVHTDDVNRATGAGIPLDRQALAACTRLLADALAVKAPGASTEVRIPPYAVVQCIEGPRHTRGTPPNVVETDPLTWIRLATGRTQWADAIEEAQVRASGERADLVGVLPIMA
jgi:uncharacterized protein (TIGR03083 family)